MGRIRRILARVIAAVYTSVFLLAARASLLAKSTSSKLLVLSAANPEMVNQYAKTLTESGYHCSVIASRSVADAYDVEVLFATATEHDEARRQFLAAGCCD
jgi:hypothetical protein